MCAAHETEPVARSSSCTSFEPWLSFVASPAFFSDRPSAAAAEEGGSAAPFSSLTP